MIVDILIILLTIYFIYLGFLKGASSLFYFLAIFTAFYLSQILLYKSFPLLKNLFNGNPIFVKLFFFLLFFFSLYEIFRYILEKTLNKRKQSFKEKVLGIIFGIVFSIFLIFTLYAQKEKHPRLKVALEHSKLIYLIKSLKQ